MRKINISKEEIEDLYINQKLSTIEIAKKFGVCDQTILNKMKKFGIKSRTKSEARLGKRLSEETKRKKSEALKINIGKKILEDLYITQKLSLAEIAKRMGVSKSTILRRMQEYNIQRRTIKESLSFEEVRKKIREGSLGRQLSEETKKRLSESHKGNKSGFYGKHLSEEHRRKISEAQKGEKNSYWKGGLKIAWTRHQAKRRQLGFKPLNKPFNGSEAHHLQDKETVIYIPKELHRRVSHNNWTGKGMNTIDALALDYLELQILGEKYEFGGS
jgi:predicted DNA-binding protein YlxM (UPF0122 family)